MRIGPSGAGRIVVFSSPTPKSYDEPKTPPMTPAVFDLASGRQAKQPRIFGLIGDVLADEKRWFAVVPALHSADPKDLGAQFVAFDWDSGREAWRFPCAAIEVPYALGDLIFHARPGRKESGGDLVATDPATGLDRWRRPDSNIRGLFLANGLLYAYDEAVDTGSGETNGEFLNVFDPATGKTVRRIQFYPDFRPASTLCSLAWFQQANRLIGTFAIHTSGQDVWDIRALDGQGNFVWNRSDSQGFHVIGGALICKKRGIFALDPATGHELWRRRDQNIDVLTGWKDMIVARIGSKLAGIDPRDGKTVWTLTLPPLPPGSPFSGKHLRKGTVRLWPVDLTVRAFGPYLAVGQTRTLGRMTALLVYTAPTQ